MTGLSFDLTEEQERQALRDFEVVGHGPEQMATFKAPRMIRPA